MEMKPQPSSSVQDNQVFIKALASVLSVSRPDVQKTIAEAKTEKPLPHKRYKYDPAKGRP
jgi:hypothetical protein